MKKLVLYAVILLCPQIVFSHFQGHTEITINANRVAVSDTAFPYSIDLSRLDTMWWRNCSSATWIAVTDTNNVSIPSNVDADFSQASRRGVLTFKAAVSTSVNSKYRIWVDSSRILSDSLSIYMPSYCYSRIGFDAASGSFQDHSGGWNNIASSLTYLQAGKLGASARFTQASSSYLFQTCVVPISGANQLTVSGIVQYVGSVSQYAVLFMHRYTSYRQIVIMNYAGTYYFYVANDPTNTNLPYASWSTSGISVGQFFHYALVVDLTATGKANQVKWFINGVQQTLSFAAPDFPAILPEHLHIYSVNMPNVSIGYNPESSGYYLDGYYDELRQYNQAKSSGWVLNEYRAAFDTTMMSLDTLALYFRVDLSNSDNARLSYANGEVFMHGARCTINVACDSGYVWRTDNGSWHTELTGSLSFEAHQDTTVTVQSALIPIIDSIRPRTWYRGKTFSIYTRGEQGPQSTGKIYFSTNISVPDDSLSGAQNWSGGLINDTIPPGALSRWYYLWYINRLGLLSSKDSIRVYIPKKWGW